MLTDEEGIDKVEGEILFGNVWYLGHFFVILHTNYKATKKNGRNKQQHFTETGRIGGAF